MNSYKLFTFLIFTLFPFVNGYALECKNLKEDLIGLEHKYQKSTLPDCTDVDDTLYCKSDKDSGKSIYKAQLDYNKALAKVNMIEGLIAISASVENSHKAMKMLEVTDLANARSSINDFLMNYERANVLNKSMVPNSEGDYFWEDYQGTSYEFSYIFIKNKCDTGKFVDFCKMIKERADDPHYDEVELYETLHGFAQADAKGKVDYQKQLRKDNYAEYRKYLQFTSSETSTPQDLSELEKGVKGQPSEIEKVHNLQDAIKDYEKNKDEATAKRIVELSNKLRDIDMNFNNNIKLSENDLVAKDIKNKFEKGLTSVAAAAGILTGENNIKNNFKTVKNSLDIELEGKERTLLAAHKGVLAKLESDCNVSNALQVKECLKSVCGNSYPRSCSKSADYPGIEGLLIDHNNYDQADQIRKANELMLDCFDPKNTFEESIYQGKKTAEKKQICLDENKKKVSHLFSSDKLQDAKDELIKTKKALDFINNGKNIKNILAEKFITIKMLKANHCLNSKSKKEAGHLNSYCDVQQLNIHTKTALQLSTDVEDILLKYNPEQYQDFIDGKGKYSPNTDGDTYFDKMVSDCKDDKNSSSVCAYFISEDNKRKDKERKEKEKQAQKDMIYKGAYNVYEEYDAAGDGNYDDGPSGFSYAMSGLATGAIQNMPGFFGYFQQRKTHERQMQMWDNQINYHNYYYGSGATHHTNNITINYDDWYANQNTFNPAGYKYFDASSSLMFPTTIPSTFSSPNMPLYAPASSSASGFNFN